MSALDHIASRSLWIDGVVGVVGRIECIEIDLRGFWITTRPKVGEFLKLLLINRTTIILTTVLAAYTYGLAIQVFRNETNLAIGICFQLTIPKEGWHVAVIIRSRIGRVEESECRVGVERMVQTKADF